GIRAISPPPRATSASVARRCGAASRVRETTRRARDVSGLKRELVGLWKARGAIHEASTALSALSTDAPQHVVENVSTRVEHGSAHESTVSAGPGALPLDSHRRSTPPHL